MSARSVKGWWIALGAALAGVILLAWLFTRPARLRPVAPSLTEERACEPARLSSLMPLPAAGNPPAVLWAEGSARLFMDGAPVFSSPDAPLHVAVGDHLFEVQAPAAQPLSTRVGVVAFEALLLHASLDPHAGLSLVRLGGICRSCDAPQTEVLLNEEKPTAPTGNLLADAAAAMRRDDWFSAATRLRQVPHGERSRALYLRLSAQLYLDTAQPEPARKLLNSLAPGDPGGLRSLLPSYDALVQSERTRRQQVVIERWNKTTERFGAMVRRFDKDAPAQIAAAAKRIEHLSQAFEQASRAKNIAGEEEAFEAARLALVQLGDEVRALKPNDCPFQTEVVSTLLR